MSSAVTTKLLSLAAMATLSTVAVLIAVPKNASGKLGTQFHTANSH